MVTGLDHIVLLCRDLPAATGTYEALLGTPPVWRSRDEASGTGTVLFQLANTALELMGPDGSGPPPPRLMELLGEAPARLTSLAFRSVALADDWALLTRRGLACSEITYGTSTDLEERGSRSWSRFRCPDEVCAGIKTFVLQPEEIGFVRTYSEKYTIPALDHIVINTPNPDRAIAHYGARLGLDFRLDQTAPQWGMRMMFFRTGGVTLEVVHQIEKSGHSYLDDRLWGLAWQVEDLAANRERLMAEGCDVSDIRTGRKPGTEVFTVKDGALGVPTLFIANTKR